MSAGSRWVWGLGGVPRKHRSDSLTAAVNNLSAAREFQTRYRSFKATRAVPAYPPKLIGLADGNNVQRGFDAMKPILIGDEQSAIKVLAGGDKRPRLTVMKMELLIGSVA